MSIETLQRRAKLLTELRAFFESRGYWEVQTPALSQDSCVDAWINPFPVSIGSGRQGYLQTSPEFSMKRLLCQGADSIYEVARVFRQEESGRHHNPEFTMVEWYRCHVDHHLQMSFVEDLVRHLARFAEDQGWRPPGSMNFPIQRLTYQQAFQQFAGIDPLNDRDESLVHAARHSVTPLPRGLESDRDGLLNLILAEQVEPQLRLLRGVFLHDFPASQGALAIVRQERAPVAERFELYLDGIELCNGYHELTDPVELRHRMQEQNRKRRAAGLPEVPEESRLLTLMSTTPLPPSSGVALGFDRLAMWCLGVESIAQVLAFPFDDA